MQIQFKTLEALLTSYLEANSNTSVITEQFNQLRNEFKGIVNDNDSVILNMSSKMNKLEKIMRKQWNLSV